MHKKNPTSSRGERGLSSQEHLAAKLCQAIWTRFVIFWFFGVLKREMWKRSTKANT